ncbi:MAG: cytochrome c [Dokdonella sp.]
MTRAFLLLTSLVVTTLLVPAPAFAQSAAAGDAVAGKIKGYTCTGCHGITGWRNAYPSYHVPKIGGQNYDYIVAALTGYKSGQRKHPTMQAQGESLSEQDIRDIAAWISSVEMK